MGDVLTVIWAIMIIASIITALLLGRADSVLVVLSESTKSAIESVITIAGMMCLWSGIFNILKETKLVKKLAAFLKKPILRLFEKNSMAESEIENISLNITSNVLGIGNAATVYGLNAVEEMQKNNLDKKTATNNMTILAVINAASIQLVPTTMITLRAINGAENPSAILVPVWIVSGLSLIAGIIAIKMLNKRR